MATQLAKQVKGVLLTFGNRLTESKCTTVKELLAVKAVPQSIKSVIEKIDNRLKAAKYDAMDFHQIFIQPFKDRKIKEKANGCIRFFCCCCYDKKEDQEYIEQQLSNLRSDLADCINDYIEASSLQQKNLIAKITEEKLPETSSPRVNNLDMHKAKIKKERIDSSSDSSSEEMSASDTDERQAMLLENSYKIFNANKLANIIAILRDHTQWNDPSNQDVELLTYRKIEQDTSYPLILPTNKDTF